MKYLLLLTLLFVPASFAQPPDCSIFFTFTAAGRIPAGGFNAGALQTGCVGWILTYYATGFTAVSLRLDSADDASGAPSTWGTFAGTPITAQGCSTSNPLTATSHACLVMNGANPWVSVDLQSVTGSGGITGYAFGCRPDHCAAFFATPGTGGGGASPFCTLTAEVPLSGTGYTQIVAGSGSTQIKLCNIVYSSSVMGSPAVNTFTVGFGTCSGTVTEAFSLPGITAYADSWNGTLQGTAGAALCAKEATANSDKVTVTYSQN